MMLLRIKCEMLETIQNVADDMIKLKIRLWEMFAKAGLIILNFKIRRESHVY